MYVFKVSFTNEWKLQNVSSRMENIFRVWNIFRFLHSRKFWNLISCAEPLPLAPPLFWWRLNSVYVKREELQDHKALRYWQVSKPARLSEYFSFSKKSLCILSIFRNLMPWGFYFNKLDEKDQSVGEKEKLRDFQI